MNKETKGVTTLLGEPRKAILKISGPMMLGMFMQAIYNVADGFWVAGLGADQLAAIGLFFPFFMIIISLGAGIGVGGSSAISRRIGEKNKKGADHAAIITLLIGFIIAVLISFPLIPFLDQIFIAIVNSESIGLLAADYARVLFGGSVVLVFFQIGNSILRGEGDARRAMYALILGSLLNIALDPLFIYVFNMGVLGAAWATLVAFVISSLLVFFWLFIKKNTYVEVHVKNIYFDKKLISEILEVGIPASLAQLSMSIAMVFLNKVIALAGGTDGVAVFTSGWRIVMLGSIPLIGMATGVTAVTGAAFGARDKEKLRTAFLYAIKIGFFIETGIAVLVMIFSQQVAFLFSYSDDASHIMDDLIHFLHIVSFIFPTIPFGMLTSAMFRGVGKGKRSLWVTILRTILLQVPVAYVLSITLDMGLTGAWIGIIAGNILAVIVSFLWGLKTVREVL